jgi:hypothetical protein
VKLLAPKRLLISLFRSFNSLVAPKISLLGQSREFARKALRQIIDSFIIGRYGKKIKLISL